MIEQAIRRLMVKHATGFDKALAAHRLANLERVDARKPEPVPFDSASELRGIDRAVAAHKASKKNLISGVALRIT